MAQTRSFRFRFTLRALLVFVTLFMLWGGYHTNRGWKERAAEEVLRRHGAIVDYCRPNSKKDAWGQLSFAYQMSVQTLWRERYINCVTVTSQFEPDLVEAICALPHLEKIHAQSKKPASREVMLGHLRGYFEPTMGPPAGTVSKVLTNENLKSLNFDFCILSDDDCHAIAHSRMLEEIGVFGCELSEEGFACLVTKPGLRRIGFSYCQVTGEKLAGVPGSATLEAIGWEASPAGMELAAFVARSPNVRELTCRSLSANDEFVAALGGQPVLKSAEFPVVTDQSIAAFIGMPQLEKLALSDGRVSAVGLGRLRSARPDIDVRVYPLTEPWTKGVVRQ